MKNRPLFLLCAIIVFSICIPVYAGPLDNAMEFQEKAVQEAERDNSATQSSAAPSISWDDESSGTGSAVNTGGAGGPGNTAGSSSTDWAGNAGYDEQ